MEPLLRETRVAEIGGVDWATRLSAQHFSDLGATVTRIGRLAPAGSLFETGLDAFFDHGKKVIPDDDPTVGDVIRQADVVFEPAKDPLPGELERVVAASPALVRVRIVGFGGDLDDLPSLDLLESAMSGASIVLGEPGRAPLHFPFGIPRTQAAFHATAAALTALRAARRDGIGQVVEVAAADVLACYTGGMSLFIKGSGGKWQRRGFERHGPIYPSGFYPCGDGSVFLATQSRRPWQKFVELMGDPEWATGDLRDGVAIGFARADEVDVHFIPWLCEHTRRELVEKAADVGEIVLGPMNEVHETLDEPHLEERGFWEHLDVGGREVRAPRMGFRIQDGPEGRTPAPRAPESHPNSDEGPLTGIRVIEFGWNWAGPMVGQLLSDFGAEVIKVETRRRKDFMRHWAHARPFFDNANRNKRSVSIDIASSDGVSLVLDLARESDVFFDNFAAGVLARRGLGPRELLEANASLVALSMAMAGQTGPLRHLRGFATIATGFAGIEMGIGYPGGGSTGLPLIGLGDLNAAVQATVAILAALERRDRTGEGAFIDLSQIEAATSLAFEPLLRFQLEGEPATPRGNAHPEHAPHGIYPARGDDQWLAIAVTSNVEWQGLVDEMGSPAWARAESLASVEGRRSLGDDLDVRIGEWTSGETRDDLVHRLQWRSVPAAPVLELSEVLEHPHFRNRGLVADGLDGAQIFSSPWHLSRTPRRTRSLAPELGEANEEILRDLLKLPRERYARLVADGVIA